MANEEGTTPLMCATAAGNLNLVVFLAKFGATIDLETQRGTAKALARSAPLAHFLRSVVVRYEEKKKRKKKEKDKRRGRTCVTDFLLSITRESFLPALHFSPMFAVTLRRIKTITRSRSRRRTIEW